MLGWSPKGEKEIFSREEFIQIFDPARLSKSPALFDRQKLVWMNTQYMKKLDVDKVVELSLPHLVKAGLVPENRTPEEEQWVRKLIALYQEQMSYGAEIVELSKPLFFTDEVEYDEEAKAILVEEQVPEVLAAFLKELNQLESFEAGEIKKAIKAVQKATGHKGKKLFMPIRVAVSGQTHGPELQSLIELLGKDKVKERLQNLIG
jgi:nondiscriminating glutamyl-tRNA synthetase